MATFLGVDRQTAYFPKAQSVMNHRVARFVNRQTPANVIRNRRSMSADPSFDIGVCEPSLLAPRFQASFAHDALDVGAGES